MAAGSVKSAACRVICNLRNRHVEPTGAGLPGGLFHRQTGAGGNDRVVGGDPADDSHRTEVPVAICVEQRRERRGPRAVFPRGGIPPLLPRAFFSPLVASPGGGVLFFAGALGDPVSLPS